MNIKNESKQKTKQQPIMCCLQETYFSFKATHRVKIKGEQIFR
jgi:hypothetical protein